jgi:hypothetical protein
MVGWEYVHAHGLPELETDGGFDGDEKFLGLDGYLLREPIAIAPQRVVAVWSCTLVIAKPLGELHMAMPLPNPQRSVGARRGCLQVRPVGHRLPVEAARATVKTLRPVRSGQAYRITSPAARGLVAPELAEALEAVFDRFARERGFTPDRPLDLRFSRGFKAGSHGHGEGAAADIVAVGGKSLVEWKQDWDQATAAAEKVSDQEQRSPMMAAEQKRNLGYGLYKALQEHGGWRVDPGGWRPYRGVMQLFGPWTASEGPWKAVQIKDPDPYQRQRLADQEWVFRAHRDHIHVAR